MTWSEIYQQHEYLKMALPTKIETVVVHMTQEEARLFILFQKHYKFVELLENADAFNLKGGFVTLHFTNEGEVGSVDVQRRYRLIH